MGNFSYKPAYGVIAMAESEEEQKRIYETLRKLGLTVKVVCV